MKREKKDFSFVIVSEISLKKPHWILNFCFLEKGKKKMGEPEMDWISIQMFEKNAFHCCSK